MYVVPFQYGVHNSTTPLSFLEFAATIVVDCAATGEPRPEVQWKKERISVAANEATDRITTLVNNSLQV